MAGWANARSVGVVDEGCLAPYYLAAMRIGISLVEPRSGSLQELTSVLQEAADDGFSSAWLADIFGLDALSALAYAGSRVAGIDVGTAVTPTYLRHPVALARQAVTTDVATGGRLALGIGLSHQVVIEGMLHLSFDKPAHHMREYLAVLLPLLREGKVSFSGETLGADTAISVRPVGALPVLLAAMAPRMLHLAGAVADGTVLWMTGPRAIAEHVMPRLAAAAAEAGRAAPRVVCVLPVCVTDDEAAARARAAKVFATYDTLPSYKAMLDLEGAGGPGDVAIVGDEAAVRQQVDELAGIGVTDFAAGEFATGEDAARTRALLHDLATGNH
jgi:5,10-methylenetetrahydromethanopterin reductase